MFTQKKRKFSITLSLLLILSMLFGGISVFANENEDVESCSHNEENTFITTNLSTGKSHSWIAKDAGVNYIKGIQPIVKTNKKNHDLDITPFGWSEPWKYVSNTEIHPYTAIARLEIRYEDNSQDNGTGFLVASGKVLTAAHCLKNRRGSMAREIAVEFGRNGALSTSFYTVYGSDFTVNSKWNNQSSKTADYDYGVISVPLGTAAYTGSFDVATGANKSSTYNLTGYPNVGKYANTHKMYTDSGKLKSISTNTFEHYFNSTGGCSGSPIYDNNNVAIGIHTYGPTNNSIRGGTGTRISDACINLLYS